MKRIGLLVFVFIIAVSLICPFAAFASDTSVETTVKENSASQNKSAAYKSADVPLFMGSLETSDYPRSLTRGFSGDTFRSCRIPSLICVENGTYEGMLVAFCDEAATGADWGKIDICVRTSSDNGVNWTSPVRITDMPVREPVLDDGDTGSAFAMDPVCAQTAYGDIVLMFDIFPESKGIHDPGRLESSSGFIEVDGEQRMIMLTSRESVNDVNTSDKTATGYTCYSMDNTGRIFDADNNDTGYYVTLTGDPATLGDVYYSVGQPDRLGKSTALYPKFRDDGNSDVYTGNIFLNKNMPDLPKAGELPQPAERVKLSPDSKDHYCEYVCYKTTAAPFRCVKTSYLCCVISSDGGKTWSSPVFLNGSVRNESDGYFLGTAPGNGIRLKNQSFSSKTRRVLIPVYNLDHASAVYSDDNGKTWARVPSDTTCVPGESCLAETASGSIISFGRQSELSNTPCGISYDGGDTWVDYGETKLVSVKCQKSIISLPVQTSYRHTLKGLEVGLDYIACVHPSGNYGNDSSRSGGVLTVGVIAPESKTIDWKYEKPLKTEKKYSDLGANSDFFAYSSMCVLADGNIGLLYEAAPSGYIVFTRFNTEWMTAEKTSESVVSYKTDVTPIVRTVMILSIIAFAAFAGIEIFRMYLKKNNRITDEVLAEAEYDEADLSEESEDVEGDEETDGELSDTDERGDNDGN